VLALVLRAVQHQRRLHCCDARGVPLHVGHYARLGRSPLFDSVALVPKRHLWWDYGIGWICRLATEWYCALTIHPDYRIAEAVKLQQPG
jgi:hypothetical protein